MIYILQIKCLFCYPLVPPHVPSSGLVDALSDEVCWERVLKLLPVFKGVVALGIRHAAALKPTVKHLRDPSQHAVATT